VAFLLLPFPSGRYEVPQKILVIEDNQDCREIFVMLIRHLGYDVIQAASAADGMQQAVNEHPDLILLDLVLPFKSGTELTAWLKNKPATRDIPVIICTASMGKERIHEAIRRGAAEVLTKPVPKAFLAEILRRHLTPSTATASEPHRER
jgi:CheY-like chemotaxis protein